MKKRIPHITGVLAVVFLFAFPFIYTRADYDFIMHLWITAFFYAILASSWSLLGGYAGQFSFGHMAFMAIGAYSTGLFSNYVYIAGAPTGVCNEFKLGDSYLVLLDPIGVTSTKLTCLDVARQSWPVDVIVTQPSIVWGILLGIVLGGVFGLLIGALVLRLRAAYLALLTIGFSEILRAAISAEILITRGQAGLRLKPLFSEGLTIFGATYTAIDKVPPYFVMLLLFLFCMAIMVRLERSRFGLFIRSIREDEEAAAALAVNTVRYKILVFVITSMMAAAAGAVQAHYVGIITPNILILLQMSIVIAMAVIGGLESIVGAAVGAVIISFTLEFLRSSFTIGPVTVDMTIWRLVVFGLLLMLTLRFWRNGLIHPILLWFSRAGIKQETVAKRMAAADPDAAEKPTEESV
ncbi:MAG: branched-chain amino acid ABC transporter permease [Deltaproteobacteria bacterium]|jgi:branched-chain amino acid transport system permease protein|nr:branched-chain amino acid ABC transporter permease [Deltaproteobacteria bacterium]